MGAHSLQRLWCHGDNHYRHWTPIPTAYSRQGNNRVFNSTRSSLRALDKQSCFSVNEQNLLRHKYLPWHRPVLLTPAPDNSYWNTRPAGLWNNRWSPLQQWQETVSSKDLLAMWYVSHWTTAHLLRSLCSLTFTYCVTVPFPYIFREKRSLPSVSFSSSSISSRTMGIFILLFFAPVPFLCLCPTGMNPVLVCP